MSDRKAFLLRIDRDLIDALQRWADDDPRSLNGQSCNFGDSRSRGDNLTQRLPLDQLHDEKRAPLVFADIVNGADMMMIESGCDTRLALEPLQTPAVFGVFGREHFQGNVALQQNVARFVDLAHATGTQPLQDAKP